MISQRPASVLQLKLPLSTKQLLAFSSLLPHQKNPCSVSKSKILSKKQRPWKKHRHLQQSQPNSSRVRHLKQLNRIKRDPLLTILQKSLRGRWVWSQWPSAMVKMATSAFLSRRSNCIDSAIKSGSREVDSASWECNGTSRRARFASWSVKKATWRSGLISGSRRMQS